MKRYKITCLKCKKSDTVKIDDDQRITYENPMGTNLLAGRYREDMNYGWECSCGSDSRISKQEVSFFNQLVTGTPQKIAEIKRSLNIPDSKKFKMEQI